MTALALSWLGGADPTSGATPMFSARRDYPVPTAWIAVADTNGDGIPDLIGGNTGSATVLFGNGNGTFRTGPVTLTKMTGAFHFLAADLSGDGTTDLVYAGGLQGSEVPNGIGVCLGNGDGSFQTVVFYQAGNDLYVANVVVGDFNGDGIPDVATVGESGVWLFTGKGAGTFNPGVLTPFNGAGNGGNNLAAADLNGDGKLDLVVTTLTGFAILPGNGDGTFQPQQSYTTPRPPFLVQIADLNRDGRPDIAVLLKSEYIYLYLGNKSGGFSGPTYADLPGEGYFAIGDLNGDGIPDLVNTTLNIAFGNGNGTFQPPVHYSVSPTSQNLVLSDLRNNGLTDIAVQGLTAISVLLSQGKGKFEDGEWTAVADGAGCGAAADYNGDGHPDLAVNTGQGIAVLLGTGKAASPFVPGTAIPLSGAGCLVTADLNGDGIPDLLVPAAGAIVAYLGNGDGTFTQKSSTPAPTGGYLAVADFNHDGKLDFATSGNLLALGNGDGTFQTPKPFVPKLRPETAGFANIAAGDLNGDGWPDLILTDPEHNYLYVLIDNQIGGFTEHVITTGARALEPTQVVFADVNGDGNLDAVVGLGLIGGAAIFLGDGKGGLTIQTELKDVIGVPGPVMVADVNGDGIPDVCLMEANSLAIFLGKGNAAFAAPFYIGAGPEPDAILAENLHGQPASAGEPDIVAPDASGGVTVLINTTKPTGHVKSPE